jgi:hypothetical protein
MALFGGNREKRDYGDKVTELKTKIVQLEAAGMTASANRLKEELKKFDKVVYKHEKPLSGGELKRRIKSAKAEGLAK